MQIWGAGHRMVVDAKAISDAKLAQQPPVGTADDPFVPSYLDVFNAYITGSPAAAVDNSMQITRMPTKQGRSKTF